VQTGLFTDLPGRGDADPCLIAYVWSYKFASKRVLGMSGDGLTRFLGDTPLRVIVRLLFLSLVVGVILSALDLDPLGVIDLLLSFVQRLWDMGFAAIEQVGKYLVLGAVIVVPIWLVSRIFSARGR
jgi:hypothetical protein